MVGHECGNWERGRAVSFMGIQKSDFVCSVGSHCCAELNWDSLTRFFLQVFLHKSSFPSLRMISVIEKVRIFFTNHLSQAYDFLNREISNFSKIFANIFTIQGAPALSMRKFFLQKVISYFFEIVLRRSLHIQIDLSLNVRFHCWQSHIVLLLLY